VYYKSRYADRLPIGDPEIVRNAPYSAAKRFYKDWYRPDLMAVMVVGDVNLDSTEQKIKSQFSSILPVTNPRPKESVSFPQHEETFVRVITDPEATNSMVQIMYKHQYEPVSDILDYRELLVYSLYNRMLGKLLAEFSRLADPPYIFGYTGYGQDVGELATYSSISITEGKNVKRAYKTLLEENQRVLLHGFTQTELDREKAAILRQAEQNVLEQDKQESSRLVQRLVNNFLDNNPIPDATQHFDLYKSMMPTITVEEVSNLASKWITNRNKVVLVTGPSKDLALLPDSVELIRMMTEITNSKPAPYVDIDVSAPLLSGTFPPQAVLKVTHDTTYGINHWEFANGVHVSAKPTTFKNDEIIMNAYSAGGHSLYDDSMYPAARSVSSVMQTSGVGPYNATGLEKKLSGLRVNVNPFVFERHEGLSGSSSVADLETMMQLTYSHITAFRTDTVALKAFINKERAGVMNALANPQNWYSDRVTKIVSQNHPRRGIPTIESYDQIKMNDIMKIYQDRFKDVSDMHFFFVGNFDPKNLQELTSRYLGALPGGGRKETWNDIGERMPSGVIDSVFNKGEAPKSLVQIIYHGKDQFDPDSSYILQSLIDLARIKLRESLRENEGGVYGVQIGGGQSKYPIEQYSIRISFNADPPATNTLVAAAKTVIEQLKKDIDPADIVKVTETQRQGRIRDLQQNQFWMGAFINGWINNVEYSQQVDLQKLEARIAKLNEAILLRAANKYFNEKEVISVVMFPEKS
ncbi:MAG: insulinase family protein, partial [Saprospiraceae bacterium]